MKKEEDHSSFVDYIIAAMSDSLYDQTAHAKVCSSHRYEKQKLMEKMMNKVVKLVQPDNIIINSSCKDMLRIFYIPDYNLVR